ncbi:MAG: adenylate/guanylate cyclase domain-containing protein, partial [Chloroflexia bacterium]|nr:adenylate/guanylate cyclase domain-containing protein [Chloroflexia bacterium]
VFGNTVNTASRVESNSEALKINISETTYNLVSGKFSFEEREPIEVKGLGFMKMFFVSK